MEASRGCSCAVGAGGDIEDSPLLFAEAGDRMSRDVITFVTQNQEKMVIARQILRDTDLRIEPVSVSVKEIQADEVSEIAAESARSAAQMLQTAVIKTDKGLYIEALKGFPGPYSHYVEERLTEVSILRLLRGVRNRRACFKEALAFCTAKGDPIVYEAVTLGRIAGRSDGTYGYGFDRIFIRDGDTLTMANYSDEERAARYSTEHWQRLLEFLRHRRIDESCCPAPTD